MHACVNSALSMCLGDFSLKCRNKLCILHRLPRGWLVVSTTSLQHCWVYQGVFFDQVVGLACWKLHSHINAKVRHSHVAVRIRMQ